MAISAGGIQFVAGNLSAEVGAASRCSSDDHRYAIKIVCGGHGKSQPLPHGHSGVTGGIRGVAQCGITCLAHHTASALAVHVPDD